MTYHDSSQSQIDEIEQMFRADDPRGKRFRRWKNHLANLFTIVNLAFIFCVAVYLIVVYGGRLLEWLDIRGK